MVVCVCVCVCVCSRFLIEDVLFILDTYFVQEEWRDATGYASQHIWSRSQARINREGCTRKGIQRKTVGMAEVGAPISQDGVAVHPDCWCFWFCYLHFAPKNPEDGEQRYDIWVSPCRRPTCLRKQEVGKPSWNAAQPCARGQGYVNDDLRDDGLQKGWAGDFEPVPGMRVQNCRVRVSSSSSS